MSSPCLLIDLQDVSFSYPTDPHNCLYNRKSDTNSGVNEGKTNCISHVSMRVCAGSRVLVVGHNGSGKSTLLSLIAGRRRPTSGTVRILGGHDPFEETALGAQLSLIGTPWPQEAFFGNTVDRIALPAPFPTRKEVFARALNLRLNRFVDRMSAGEKRRTQILHGLLTPASIYLLDECGTNIDVAERQTMLKLVQQECDAVNGCCLYATHILDYLDTWATHMLLMHHGQVVSFVPTSVIREPLEQFALRFISATTVLKKNMSDADLVYESIAKTSAILSKQEPSTLFEKYRQDGISSKDLQAHGFFLQDSKCYFDRSMEGPWHDTMTSSEKVILCQDLSFRDVFHHISFHIFRGERVLLCGCNGSGKSTLLNIIGGKQFFCNTPTSLQVLGKACYDDMTLNAQIAYGGDWWTDIPGGEVYVREMLSIHTSRARCLCKLLSVNMDWDVRRISSGELKRVQLLLHLLEDKPIVLLDEATADLDVDQRHSLLTFLYMESVCRGVTVMYSTHIFGGLEAWASALILLDRSKRGIHTIWRERDGAMIRLDKLAEELALLKSRERFDAASPHTDCST